MLKLHILLEFIITISTIMNGKGFEVQRQLCLIFGGLHKSL